MGGRSENDLLVNDGFLAMIPMISFFSFHQGALHGASGIGIGIGTGIRTGIRTGIMTRIGTRIGTRIWKKGKNENEKERVVRLSKADSGLDITYIPNEAKQ